MFYNPQFHEQGVITYGREGANSLATVYRIEQSQEGNGQALGKLFRREAFGEGLGEGMGSIS